MQRTEQAQDRRTAATRRELLERARRGDAGAYGAVVASRLAPAHQLARAILGPEGDADDAASCALVAAWRELPRLDDLDRFDDWLDRIVISECRMRLGASGPAAMPPVPVPPDLAARTMEAVLARPRRTPSSRRGPRTVLAGAAVAIPVLLAVALAAAWGVGALRGPGGGPGGTPGGSGQATSAPGIGAAPGTASAGPAASGATPPFTGGTPAPGASNTDLVPGMLAVVSLQGDNLRVRTTPGTGDPATRLKPLLPAGTRMLIVGGPVRVDDLDWYEIQTDGELIDLFGWVAAGDDGDAWITPAVPRCWGDLGASTVVGLDRVDFLACYGRTEVKVRARAAGLWDVRNSAGDCGWIRKADGCDVDNGWLLLPAAKVTLVTDAGAEHDLTLAMPPDLSEALAKLPRQSTLLLTVSMDAPESAACRARDVDTGDDVIPGDRAVTACRLQFVVQEVAFRDPAASASPDALPN